MVVEFNTGWAFWRTTKNGAALPFGRGDVLGRLRRDGAESAYDRFVIGARRNLWTSQVRWCPRMGKLFQKLAFFQIIQTVGRSHNLDRMPAG